jgi:hypothetical protein
MATNSFNITTILVWQKRLRSALLPQVLCIAKINDIKLCRGVLRWAGRGVSTWPFTFLAGLAAAAGLLRHDGREVRTRHPAAAAGLSLNEHETIMLCVHSDDGCFGQLK